MKPTLREDAQQDAEHARLVARLAANPINQRFTDDQIEGMHAVGCGLYRQGKYEQALNLFLVSALYRPAQTQYMMCVGACHQKLQHAGQALQAFELVVAIEPGHLEARLQAARCLLTLGRSDAAQDLLREIATMAASHAGPTAIPRRAASLLALVTH